MKQKLILIGSSTGGPGHLEKILSALPKDYNNTIIIAQHMDNMFVPSMIKRLDAICSIDVLQAQENKTIKTPSVVFAHQDLSRLELNSSRYLSFSTCRKSSFYTPSVNNLFLSAADLSNKFDFLAIILTGIGDDGAEGLMALKNSGHTCISEHESTCIVYGMPKVALDTGASSQDLKLQDIITKIINF